MKHELNILRQLNHPNICSLWGYEKGMFGTPDVPSIVTEYCINGTLAEYLIKQAETLDILKRIKLIENILKAIEYLHDGIAQVTIVHGNINTDSVVVDKYGIPKIQNFEFSHQYARDTLSTLIPAPAYTPSLVPAHSRWHPPEFFIPTDDWPLVTRHADLWATGCLLLKIISGQEPYSGTNVPAVFARIKNSEAPYSRGACPSDEIWDVAGRLWVPNPLQRISATKALQLIRLIV
ncbi:Ephrin type-A receptor 5 [Ceratobasidium sp. 428]|nr:Ephrin type-A receptor 5 [Ceratobasidium sp. 428]